MNGSVQARVLALAGAGVFIAAAALSLLSRQTLLALERDARSEEARAAQIAAGVLARDLVRDLETLQTAVSAPRVPRDDGDGASWQRQLVVSSRQLRLGDGICAVDAAGRPYTCVPDALAPRLANAELARAVTEAVAARRPAVSGFAAQPRGDADAVAVVPTPATEQTVRAAVSVVGIRSAGIRGILSSGGEPEFTLEPSEAPGTDAQVAGAPWIVQAPASAAVTATIERFKRTSLWFAPAIAAIALLLGWGLALSIRRSLQTLTIGAERIASGNLDEPIPGGSDEIGRLGAALDRMRARLKSSIDAVEQTSAALERRVEERTRQLQQLFGKVISAQEDERRRVARDLHDETSQLLAALGMALHAGPESDTAHTAALASLVDRMHEGLQRVIVNLRPSIIDDFGLGAAIHAVAAGQSTHTSCAVRCELGDLEERRLAPAAEIALFRVVQEAILNAVRHASATEIAIEGGVVDGRLWIEIADNGCGFDPASIDPNGFSLRGIGLAGMRERMELLGGRLEIESEPGAGTRIHVDLRLDAVKGNR